MNEKASKQERKPGLDPMQTWRKVADMVIPSTLLKGNY